MNKIRYLSLMVLLLCSVFMLGNASPYPRLLADMSQLTVVADPPEGGSVSGGGSYEAGDIVEVYASANADFQFVNWTRNGEVISTESSFSYTKGDGDETLIAHFIYNPSNPSEPDEPDIKKKYVLNLVTEEGGTSLSGAGTYEEGASAYVSVSANTGFAFQGWYNSAGEQVSSEMHFYYTVTGPETLTARFTFNPSNPGEPSEPDIKHNYVLTLMTEEGGSDVSGAGTYQEGTSVRVSVYVETGYTFVGWYNSKGELVSNNRSFSYTVTSNETLTARFRYTPDNPGEPDEPDIKAKHRIVVKATPEDGGTVEVDKDVVEEGAETTLRAYPNTGFVFSGWYVGDELYSTSRNYKYTMGNSDVEFEGRFDYNPDGPSEPSLPDNHRVSIYLTSVNGLPGRTVQYPVYLSCLDSLTDIRFNITFPAGFTPQKDNIRLSGKAQGYTLTMTEVTEATSGAPRRAENQESTYQFVLNGGVLPPCNTRLMVVNVDVADNVTEVSNQVAINQVFITDIYGNNTTASTRNGRVVMHETSGEGVYYYLTVIATGNGQASVNSVTVRNSLQVFDLLEGSSTNIYFTPDAGYHVEQVMLGELDITAEVVGNSRYLLSNVHEDAQLTVTFAEGGASDYNLTVSASGQGSVVYNGQEVRNGSQVFSIHSASEVELTITPDNGYYIEKVLLDGATDVTADVVDGKYSIPSMTSAHTIAVTFERMKYDLTISHNGNVITITSAVDAIWYNFESAGTVPDPATNGIRYTGPFTVTQNTIINAAVIIDNVVCSDVVSLVVDWIGVSPVIIVYDGRYFSIEADATAQVNYSINGGNAVPYMGGKIEVPGLCTVHVTAEVEGMNTAEADFSVNSYFDGRTAQVRDGGSFSEAFQWCGTNAALNDITAILWNKSTALSYSEMQGIENPNLLLYVANKALAPGNVKNIVVGDSVSGYKAQQIVLTDTETGNGNFYCPIPFTASRITYEREFLQYTEPDSCRGWETLVLPFAPQSIMHERNGVLRPFAAEGEGRPFWLREFSSNGFVDAKQIEANKPYVIAMPNHVAYDMEYRLGGWVTFSAYGCNVPQTNLQTATDSTGTIRFIPALSTEMQQDSVYALNVGEEYLVNNKKYAEGSIFVAGWSDVRPFHCYTQHVANSPAPRFMPLAGWSMGDATGISEELRVKSEEFATAPVYNLKGQRVMQPTKGIYIVNGKKVKK